MSSDRIGSGPCENLDAGMRQSPSAIRWSRTKLAMRRASDTSSIYQDVEHQLKQRLTDGASVQLTLSPCPACARLKSRYKRSSNPEVFSRRTQSLLTIFRSISTALVIRRKSSALERASHSELRPNHLARLLSSDSSGRSPSTR